MQSLREKKQQPGLASNSWPQGGHDSRWSKKIAERYVLLFNMLLVLQKICTSEQSGMLISTCLWFLSNEKLPSIVNMWLALAIAWWYHYHDMSICQNHASPERWVPDSPTIISGPVHRQERTQFLGLFPEGLALFNCATVQVQPFTHSCLTHSLHSLTTFFFLAGQHHIASRESVRPNPEPNPVPSSGAAEHMSETMSEFCVRAGITRSKVIFPTSQVSAFASARFPLLLLLLLLLPCFLLL